MATKTLFFESVELSSKVWRTSESAPSSANEATTIKNGTGAAGRYYSFVPGVTDSVAFDTSFVEGDTDGAHGWRSEVIYGSSFVIQNWVISFKLKNRAKYAHAGTVNARIYKTSVANPTVGELTKLNAVDGVSATISFSATAGEVKTGVVSVWCNQNLMLDGEYIFVILNWKVTTAGGNVQAGVIFVCNEGAAEQAVTADYYEGSPLEVQVGADTDDCHVWDTNDDVNPPWDDINVTTNAWCAAGKNSFGSRIGTGQRFQAVNVPQGVTIDVAYLIFTAKNDGSGTTVNTNIFGEDADNTNTFSTVANYNNRLRTSLVAWDNIGAWTADIAYNSPSIVAIVQVIVDRVGWAANNSMAFFWENDLSSTSAVREAHSWDSDQTKTAILHLEWEEGVEAVGDIIQSIWHVRQAVGDTSQYIWNVLAALSAIGDTFELVWHTRQSIGQAKQALWNVAYALGKATQSIWHIREIITKTNEYVWDIRAAVYNTNQYVWNVLSALTTIADTVQIVWHIRQALGKTVQPLWNVRAIIYRTRQVVWNILTPVSDTLQSVWGVRGLVANASQLVWNLRKAVSDSTQLVWNVLWSGLTVQASMKLIWRVGKYVRLRIKQSRMNIVRQKISRMPLGRDLWR